MIAQTAPRRAVRWLMMFAVVVSTSAGCSGSTTPDDRRAWFRGYVDRAVADLTSAYHLQPAPVWIGTCDHHVADVNWQSTMRLAPGFDVTTAHARFELTQDVSGRLQVDLQLPPGHVHIIASPQPDVFADTAVVTPASGSRIQVSVPDPQTVLMVGYVGC